MNVKEFYESIGSSYEETISRLGSEALIKRLLQKFLDDKNMEKLEAAVKEGNVELAFMAAHTLKGVAMNMNFGALADISSELTEMLRGKKNGTDSISVDPELIASLRSEYKKVLDNIQNIEG